MYNPTNEIWQQTIERVLLSPDFTSSPRGMEVREVINGSYTVPMPAHLNLADRKVNTKFMFAEAAWIVSGSNRLSEITPYMKSYGRFSDDGVFMRGAYGPRIVDQLGYVVDSIEADNDSRQAVLTIWRERPGKSKDIPCTVSMQFLARDGQLHAVVNMRSNDVILGFTYDVFTFSMVAFAVVMLLSERGINLTLGNLHVNAGSLHVYSDYYDRAAEWLKSSTCDWRISEMVGEVIYTSKTYEDLVSNLQKMRDRNLSSFDE